MGQPMEYVDLRDMLKGFSKPQQDWIFNSTGAIQLNVGCSSQCSPLCSLSAPKSVKKAFSFESLKWAIDNYGKVLADNGFYPYWRSDPLDWRDGDKTIIDFLDHFESVTGEIPYVSTTIPEDAFDIALMLLEKNRIGRISNPYYTNKEGETVFPIKDRLDRWLSYVAKKNDISPAYYDAFVKTLPIEDALHHIEGQGCWESLLIITPKERLHDTGIYYHRRYCKPSLDYMNFPVTTETISGFNMKYSIRSRMMT
jgi:hypothetical protein